MRRRGFFSFVRKRDPRAIPSSIHNSKEAFDHIVRLISEAIGIRQEGQGVGPVDLEDRVSQALRINPAGIWELRGERIRAVAGRRYQPLQRLLDQRAAGHRRPAMSTRCLCEPRCGAQ